MKKMYFDIRVVILFGVFFSMGFAVTIFHEGNPMLNIICLILIGSVFAYSIFGFFNSLSEYNEKGYRYWWFGYKSFLWKDVRLVIRIRGNYAVTIWFQNQNKNHFLRLTSIGTREYFKVLGEIIGYIQAENPQVKIDPIILKQIENPPKFIIG